MVSQRLPHEQKFGLLMRCIDWDFAQLVAIACSCTLTISTKALLLTVPERGCSYNNIKYIYFLKRRLKCGGAVKQCKLQRSGGCEIHHHHLLNNLLEHINNIILCVSIVHQRVVLLLLSVNRRCCIDRQFYQAATVIHHSKETVMSKQAIY